MLDGSAKWGVVEYGTVQWGSARRTTGDAEVAARTGSPLPVGCANVQLGSAWRTPGGASVAARTGSPMPVGMRKHALWQRKKGIWRCAHNLDTCTNAAFDGHLPCLWEGRRSLIFFTISFQNQRSSCTSPTLRYCENQLRLDNMQSRSCEGATMVSLRL